MITTRIHDIAAAAGGCVIPEKMKDAFVRSVEIDSRKITLGALFIPIIGERVDGHDYIESAFDLGATCALINADHLKDHEEKLPFGKALIVVENTEAALEKIAEAYRRQFPIPVVGVTGSVGKTSCKDLVTAALGGSVDVPGFKTLKTTGNHNNNIGMPLTLFELDESYQAAVMEMGMDHFGEITRLSRTARPKVGIITNIGISHLENLGTREGILKAKMEIADYLEKDGILFLNGDDCRLYGLKGKRPERIEYFGWGEQNEGRIVRAELTADGKLDFEGIYQGETWQVVVNTPGRHMAMNVMPAIMTGCFLGLSKEQILAGISTYEPADGRLNVHHTDLLTVIDDSYNASPDSMRGALDTLRDLPGNGRRIAILGEMYELGSQEEAGHREVGAYAAGITNLDALWTVGPMADWIAEEASARNDLKILRFETPEALLEQLNALICPEDIIVVKASNGMHLNRVVNELLEKGK